MISFTHFGPWEWVLGLSYGFMLWGVCRMPRAKKEPSAPAGKSRASTKRVASVNPEAAASGTRTNGDLQAAIRARAYEIYEERGRTDGLADEDWARAEREVLSQQGKQSA
jgi:hypothetical protein